MGRSPGSRNRKLVLADGVVSTRRVDPSASAGDTTLTLYDAMVQESQFHIVSNGDQTTTTASYIRHGGSFTRAMDVRTYEHDAPTNTPRITAYHDMDADRDEEPVFGISVIRRGPDGEAVRDCWTDQALGFQYGSQVGYCVHTYQGDGDPPLSFDEPPFRVPVADSADVMATMLWDALDTGNRIAVVAKTMHYNVLVEVAIRSAETAA